MKASAAPSAMLDPTMMLPSNRLAASASPVASWSVAVMSAACAATITVPGRAASQSAGTSSSAGCANGAPVDAGHDELVARELRVSLELDAERAEVGAQVVECLCRQVDAESRGEVAHVLPFAFAAGCVRGQREERHAQGRLQRFGGSRMHFLVQFQPQVDDQSAAAVARLSCSHSLRGARTNPSDA